MIGFGGVIKLPIRFKEAWWTQYPKANPLLTGWLAGSSVEQFTHASSQDILDAGLLSLTNIFQISKEKLNEQCLTWQVINWPTDPFALGAYSYTTPETTKARAELIKPVDHILFFAREAVSNNNDLATVEAALISGLEVSKNILTLQY